MTRLFFFPLRAINRGRKTVFFIVFCAFSLQPAANDAGIFPAPPELSDSLAFALARDYLEDREEYCSELPGAIVLPDTARPCTHPLDDYLSNKNDSLYIKEGGKPMLAAYRAFRSAKPNPRSYSFVHTEFLPLTAAAQPGEDPWIKRQLKKIFGWTLEHLLRFIVPIVERLWGSLSGPGRIAAILCVSLVLVVFLALLGRSLAYSPLLQRGLETESMRISAATPVRWIDNVEENIRSCRHREALSSLYRWLIAWVTERNLVGRHQWWTNRQLLGTIGTARKPLSDLAHAIVSRYEETEYGHRPADPAQIELLFEKTRSYIAGGRP